MHIIQTIIQRLFLQELDICIQQRACSVYETSNNFLTSFCRRLQYQMSEMGLYLIISSFECHMNGLWNELRLYYLHAQRRCGWRVAINYFTIFVNQELCEVPLDAIPENTTLAGLQELVYRCSTSTIYIDLK